MFKMVSRLLLFVLISYSTVLFASAQVTLSFLRAENLVLIESSIRPLFSWNINGPEHGVIQTSYQIFVSEIRSGGRNVWNSGIVVSNKTQLIKYAGLQLAPNTRYIWSVHISTSVGSGTASSGFMIEHSNTSGLDYATQVRKRDESQPLNIKDYFQTSSLRIWTPDADSFTAPAGDRGFRYLFDVPTGETALSVLIMLCVDDYFSLYVNGELIANDAGLAWQQAYWYDIMLVPNTTQIVFAIKGTNNQQTTPKDEDNPAGIIVAMQITPTGGTPNLRHSDTSWRSTLIVPDGFQSPSFDDTTWPTAKILGGFGDSQWKDTIIFPSDPPRKIQLFATPPQNTILSSSSTTPVSTPSFTDTTNISLTSKPLPPTTPPITVPPSPTNLSLTTNSSITFLGGPRSSTTPPIVEGRPNNQNIHAVIGGVIGSVVLVFLTLAGYLWYHHKRKNRTQTDLLYTPFDLKYGDGSNVQSVHLDTPLHTSLSRHPTPIATPQGVTEQSSRNTIAIQPSGSNNIAELSRLTEQDDSITLVGGSSSRPLEHGRFRG